MVGGNRIRARSLFSPFIDFTFIRGLSVIHIEILLFNRQSVLIILRVRVTPRQDKVFVTFLVLSSALLVQFTLSSIVPQIRILLRDNVPVLKTKPHPGNFSQASDENERIMMNAYK